MLQFKMLSLQLLLTNAMKGMIADSHITHISKVLQMYNKNWCGNVLPCDECSVNEKIASGSHIFNLMTMDQVNAPQLIPAHLSVSTLMKKARGTLKKASTLKLSVELGQYSIQNRKGKRHKVEFNVSDAWSIPEDSDSSNQVAKLFASLPTHIELDSAAIILHIAFVVPRATWNNTWCICKSVWGAHNAPCFPRFQ